MLQFKKSLYICIVKNKQQKQLKPMGRWDITAAKTMEKTMSAKNQKQVEIVSQELKSGQFGYTIITATEPKMNKTNNVYYGRVKKISIYKNSQLGCRYENVVNARRESEGKAADFEAQAPKGKTIFNKFFYQSVKEPETFYLKIIFYKSQTKIESSFLVDGRPATNGEIEQIRAFMPKPSSSAARQGLEAEDEVKIIAPKWENVLQIKQGDRTIFQRGL